MALRLSTLPPGLKQSLLLQLSPPPIVRHASIWARNPRFSSQFFTKLPAPVPPMGRKLLWLIPVAGGIVLYFAPRQKSNFPAVFESPTLIPCPPRTDQIIEPTILSPAEPDKSIILRIVSILRERIWEPILTARRFVHLLLYFVPVLLTSPMLLVGLPEERLKGDRWGAVWWYGFLTAQMQRAGPTFVKVCLFRLPERPFTDKGISVLVIAMGSLPG